jgi:predicted nuclease with TOPRIM domain
MNNSDETLKKQSENEAVLQAIAELARTVAELSNTVNNLFGKFDNLEGKFDNLEGKFDNLDKFVIGQFEAVREGIEYNSSRYDRLEAKFFDVRSDVSNM